MAHLYPWSISIKKTRENFFWSQKELAERINSDERSVRSWELGETIPSLYFRRKLCEIFGKTAEELSLDPDTVRKTGAALKSFVPEEEVVNKQPGQIIEGSITTLKTTVSNIEQNQPTILQSTTTSQNRFGDPYPSIWNVPRRHKASFVGRDTTFKQIYDSFSPDQTNTLLPQALNGLGGVGKTQMAVEYAYRYRNNYQAVLWVNAATAESLQTNYLALAHLLKLPDTRLQTDDELIQSIKQWFTTNAQWLLIFDNVDHDNANLKSINYDYNHIAQLDPWLPKTAPGHILFTTRAQAVGDLAQSILLEPLRPEDGALCVLRRAQIIPWNEKLNTTTTKRVEAAEKLSHLTGGLALALEQAGAYMEDTGCGIVRYLELYTQEVYRSRLHEIRSGPVPDYPLAVAFTWKVSCQAVQANPAATIILTLCAFLSPDAIPEEIFTKGAPALAEEIFTPKTPVPGLLPGKNSISLINFNEALRSLRQYSLLKYDVDRDTDIPRLSIHRLLQEIQIADMDEETQQFWASCAVQVVALTLPHVEWQIIRPHVKVCLQHIERWHIRSHEANVLRQAAEH